VTSEFIASSVNTNPVVIRKLMGQLREAGIIEVAAGTGGIRLTREPAAISLLDIYWAVEATKPEHLFRIHEEPAAACRVGGHIEALLEPVFGEVQSAMEAKLSAVSLGQLLSGLNGLRRG
jgi:DNA-binding IscR family transcriptional regulator